MPDNIEGVKLTAARVVPVRTRSISWADLTSDDLERWSELHRRLAAPPDLAPGWSRALISAHAIPADQVSVLLVEEGGRARTVWPFRLRVESRLGLRGAHIEPLNSLFSLHLRFLTDGDSAAALAPAFELLQSRGRAWSTFSLQGLVEGDPVVSVLSVHAKSKRWLAIVDAGGQPPYLEVKDDWASYLSRKSANFRSNLKRKSRRLHDAGAVEIRFVTEPAEVAAALHAIADIENQSWKASAGTAITSRSWEQRFYSALATEFGGSGDILITLLNLNGKSIAYDLTLLGHDRAYCLKTSFDATYAELSPGIVMRAALMKRLFDARIREYDFLGNNERYKLEWTDTVRRVVSVRCFNPRNVLGLALGLRHRLGRNRGFTG